MYQVLISLLAFGVAVLAYRRAWNDHFTLVKRNGELESELSNVKRVLKHRGNLANEIAHEIKNPITAILCSAETLDLLLAQKLDENHRTSLRYIREYGDNLLRLVSDFLDLSRAEGGNIQSNPLQIEVCDICQSIVGLLEASAERKQIKLHNLIQNKGIYVYADPVHVKQILFNLIHNAIKFTRRNGEISVSCTKAAEEGKVMISVEDTGVGMTSEHLEHIFDPYVKYEKAMSCAVDANQIKQGGVGLGLALSKMLVEASGGEIKVSSVPNQGSIFSFTLPSVEVSISDSSAESEMSGEDKPLSGRHYLLVHDKDSVGDAVSRLIEAWGATISHVSEAKEALEAISRANYDAVIVDENLSSSSELQLANGESLNTKVLDKPLNGPTLLKHLLQ